MPRKKKQIPPQFIISQSSQSLLPCVWMKHFNHAEKLKYIIIELLTIKFSSFSK